MKLVMEAKYLSSREKKSQKKLSTTFFRAKKIIVWFSYLKRVV